MKLPDNQQTWTEWEAMFREANVEKRRSETARGGEEKTFRGYAANERHDHLRQRGNKASAVPSPLPIQLLDSL